MAHFQGTSAFHRLLPFARLATRHAQDLAQSIWRNLLPSQLAQTIGLKTQLNSDRIDLADFTIYLRQMAAMSPEFFFHVLEEASRHCSDDLLPRIRVPTLVIAGALDRFVPLATMRQVAFAIPGAEWWVIHEATHALPAEFPAELSREISDFIARIDRL
jgi:pimeloyl-ACP methyl ester carboxylesterase